MEGAHGPPCCGGRAAAAGGSGSGSGSARGSPRGGRGQGQPLPLSPRCCVPGCGGGGGGAPPAVLRPIPRSPGVRQRWIQAIVGRRPEGERRQCSLELGRIRKLVICSDHFKPGEAVTPETLPSVFTPRRAGEEEGGAVGRDSSSSSSAPLPSSSSSSRPSSGAPGPALTSSSSSSSSRPAQGPEDRDAAPPPGQAGRGRIGDLVLAAELMEMVSETVQHVQKEARFEQAFGHDHGAYVVPDDTPTLKKMVKEMKDTIYAQNGRLGALQRELASTLAQYKELKERYETERWNLSLELGTKITELQMQNATLRCEREGLDRRLRKLQEQLDSTAGTVLFLSQQMKEKESKVKEAAFSVENMRPGRKWVRFYTGFQSYEKFEAFLHFVTRDASLCSGKIRGNIARGRLDAGPHSTLSHADQLLLVMCRLRLGLLLQDLAYRFKISETTVSRVWLNWTEVIQARLMQVPVMCSPKYVEVFQPKRTVQHRGRPVTLLDCTDLFFEVQAKERGRPDSAQPYRNHYVRRGYALASPAGYMTFASSLAFGITARGGEEGMVEEEEERDEEEEEEEEEEGDAAQGMVVGGAERGAGGAAAAEMEGREVLRLPDFFQEGALTEEQRGLTRQMLSVRSHVDKVLNFRFLKCIYPRTMEAQVDRAWIICSYLACLLHEPMGLR